MAEQPRPTHLLTTPLEGTGHRPWDPLAPIDAPLRLLQTTVAPQWVDYNGHMSESCYLLVFGDNSDVFFRFIGIDEDYRAAGHSLYTVQTQIHDSGELVATGEQMLVHVDMRSGRSTPMPPEMQTKVQAIRASHAGLPKPAQAGAPIGIRRKPG